MIRTIATAFVFIGFATLHSSAQDTRAQAPNGLIISYSADVANRPALRKGMLADTVPRLNALQRKGVIAHYRLLWSRYADNLNWDAMLIVDFSSTKNISGWTAIETNNPGGLSISTARMVRRIESAPIDAARLRRANNLVTPTYLVVPYDYVVPLPDYLKYVDGYVIPQLEGWLAENALQGYDVIIARYATARPWSSMLLLNYRGDEGLANRDNVLAKVRQRLGSDPQWKAFSENKQHVRDEHAPVVADLIAER
jgi:hypothetical protein